MNPSASYPFATRVGPPPVSPRLNDKCSSSRKWAIASRRSAAALDSAFASEFPSEFPPLSLVILSRVGRGVVA